MTQNLERQVIELVATDRICIPVSSVGVMTDLGFSEGIARSLYPELMEVSLKLSRQRGEERRVIVG